MNEHRWHDFVTEITMETNKGRFPANGGDGGLVSCGIEENGGDNREVHSGGPQRNREV